MTRFPLLRRGLYAITDGPRDDLVSAVETVLAGGAVLVQYRDKTNDAIRRLTEARALVACCARYGVMLIVNDDTELAAAAGAAGVHLGERDVDVATARAQLGANAIIGVSCYASAERATELAAAGADYLAFGAFFASPTKPAAHRAAPDLLRQSASLGKPLVAIGGITPDNARVLLDAGVDLLAVISGVFGQPDPHAAAARYAALFKNHH